MCVGTTRVHYRRALGSKPGSRRGVMMWEANDFKGLHPFSHVALSPGQIQRYHMRILLDSFENNFAAVGRDVEIMNVEVGR
jgi:hypothetical protein